MKLNCRNCGQSYNTKNLPPNADATQCPYCGHSVTILPRKAPAGPAQSPKRGWIRTLAFLIIFAIPAIINYFDDSKPRQPQEEQGVSKQSVYLAGFYLQEAEELYYDKHKTYTDDIDKLFSVAEPKKFEQGIVISIPQANDQGFVIKADGGRSDKIFVFKQMPALHRAARSGDVAKMEKLLNEGENINLKDSANRTPLYYARTYKQPKAEQFLKAKGAIE